MSEPLTVLAPVSGVVRAMADVPDPVFGGELVGPGLAIDPVRDGVVEAIAPIDGTIVKLHAHAFVVTADAQHSALVHLGLDTVQLGGAGFTLHAKEGDVVKAGDVVVSWNPAEVEAGGRSPMCPVVALDAKREQLTELVTAGADIRSGAALFEWS
ncbi:MAG: PTS glucose transporter subunit IIA [Cellulomonas sp. 73-145]|uniref:PTS sugar transporter subunit IIA n=1 Tax=Cellulomonas sp. 73-145 TaxID=1895739 RepID=UPI00092AF9AB|nr:PTS glucose transporter subunit IIA [Cellulomonas sp. 73-145]MBN9326254.1 PTS glucose transporter subunit IIA [Cellulomonas sp.]OJV57053.1 MAG: PTS glucose transporter subunit IIA [Cellulomonas sp. 73-145]